MSRVKRAKVPQAKKMATEGREALSAYLGALNSLWEKVKDANHQKDVRTLAILLNEYREQDPVLFELVALGLGDDKKKELELLKHEVEIAKRKSKVDESWGRFVGVPLEVFDTRSDPILVMRVCHCWVKLYI